ncbi:unnamed protein product [Danaus chrysippus]|uniref:(African queen) hypothetical protein n=1 Tax=Danaus chrysippus TaxID=151541 RepID=A0A8J2VVH4_9NEOP|nr:unnamed protein product [Danaus chrysippus]
MQRPINNPSMRNGVPTVSNIAVANSYGHKHIPVFDPCFNMAPPVFQPNSCFMSASYLRKICPPTPPQRIRYDPCFN